MWPLAVPSDEHKFEVKHYMGIFQKQPCSRVERAETGATVLFPLKQKAGTKIYFFCLFIGKVRYLISLTSLVLDYFHCGLWKFKVLFFDARRNSDKNIFLEEKNFYERNFHSSDLDTHVIMLSTVCNYIISLQKCH